MFAEYMDFEDYIKNYKLERSEAVLLRHLSEVYKALSQTVPPACKTEEVLDAETYLKDHLISIDSSLIDEWETMRNPDYVPAEKQKASHPDRPFTHNKKNLTKLVREKIFTAIKYLAHDNITALLPLFTPTDPDGTTWNLPRLDPILDHYYTDHHNIRLDPEARNAKHFSMEETNHQEEGNLLKITQTITDDDLHNDWCLVAHLDLEESNKAETPILTLESIAPVSEI